jgi:hypothetical protein
MKLIYKASDINEANIVAGMLRANGIEAHVGGFYLQGGVGDLAATDFATIHVADEDVELARALIDEYESESIVNDSSAENRKRTNFLLSIILFAIIIIAIFYYFVS